MLSISPDKQIRAYSSLRALEARAQAVEELVGSLKRRCLHGGPGAVDEVAAAAGELRAQLRQLTEQAAELETVFRSVAQASPLPERRREPREATGMRGTTDVLSVADLMGFLSSVKKTGTLTLQSSEATFVFEFQNGAVVHAVTNETDPDLRLGTILVAQNMLTEQQLQDSLEASAVTKEILGDQLVRSQTVSETDLRFALELQVRKIFESAFQLAHANFTFHDGNLSNIAQRTSLNTMHLLLEAARQTDEKRRRESGGATSATKSVLDSILPG